MKGLVCITLLFVSCFAHADSVIPRESVRNGVNIRASDTSDSIALGLLAPGESLPYVGSVPNWHQVELTDGAIGYVSKRWTRLQEDLQPYFAGSPFTVHFLDVGTGDAVIIDMGDKEIIIDGGNYKYDLYNYVNEHSLVDGAVELVVVTHGDQDHWKGLAYPLGLDGQPDTPLQVMELWDAGYNRDCNIGDSGNGRQNYLEFISGVEPLVTSGQFKRPLEDFHPPSDITNQISPFSLDSLPGVEFTILHSESTPAQHSECSYMVNNASIVMMVEIEGVRMLFTGDANGKERDERSGRIATEIEGRLIALDNGITDDLLKADLLKAPHHGSETANTIPFIEAVDPTFIIFSASTVHHLPKPTVLSRYEGPTRVSLRTDIDRARMNDHIICGIAENGFDCQYEVNVE